MVPSADDRHATDGRATTTMKKRKSGSKEGRDGSIGQALTPALSQGEREKIEIDARIKELGDWRGEMLARVRMLIKQADPKVVEEVKWRKPSNSMSGVPVWSHDGIICTGETYKDKVKLTFAKGASLPSGLFNAGLEGNTRRAIDFHEGGKINEKALKALVRQALALNSSDKSKPPKKAKS